ncbi:MAG: hypothetical protein U1E71_06640 [Ramlibacter sp.]
MTTLLTVRNAAGVGGLRQQALGEAQQAVAGAVDVQALTGGAGEVAGVKLAVQVGVADGFVDGRQAVAVGVVGVLHVEPARLKLVRRLRLS